MTKMKKVLALICALVLMILPLTAMASSTKYVNTANGGSLNMRQTPHTHSKNVVVKLPFGTKVIVEEYYDNHTWAYGSATVNGKTYKGYVMTRHLSSNKPTVKPTTAPSSGGSSSSGSSSSTGLNFKNFKHIEPTIMSVRPSTPGGFVNLRWGPSKSVAVMDKLYADTQVTVIAKDGTWAQVYDAETGYVGFMMLSFLNH